MLSKISKDAMEAATFPWGTEWMRKPFKLPKSCIKQNKQKPEDFCRLFGAIAEDTEEKAKRRFLEPQRLKHCHRIWRLKRQKKKSEIT